MSVLLYDPDCGFCSDAAQLLARSSVMCEIAPMTPARLAAHGIAAARAEREIPFVGDDGQVLHGAAAIAAALRTATSPHPQGMVLRLAGRAMDLPLARTVAAVAYRWVADHRHQLPGGTAACALPDGAAR